MLHVVTIQQWLNPDDVNIKKSGDTHCHLVQICGDKSLVNLSSRWIVSTADQLPVLRFWRYSTWSPYTKFSWPMMS